MTATITLPRAEWDAFWLDVFGDPAAGSLWYIDDDSYDDDGESPLVTLDSATYAMLATDPLDDRWLAGLHYDGVIRKGSTEVKLSVAIRKWRAAQTTVHLIVAVPRETAPSIQSAVLAAGGKILEGRLP